MAVTKIHGIKTTVDKAIEYICNPDKTDQNLYISSFACSPETAALDFKYTLDHTHDCRDPHNTNKAFHLIQAFSPGEVSYEEAHQIGRELADRLLEGKYSYVLTTHTDKGHVHNHLIFCSADNITFSHYHDCKKNYWKIRNLSDTLCQEHNLSTIMPNGKKGMKYNEWAANKSESSKKAQLPKNEENVLEMQPIENADVNATDDEIQVDYLEKTEEENSESSSENEDYPGEDVVEIVNLKGETTTVYKLADGRYMDRIERIFIFDGVDTWTDINGAEWNQAVN